MKDATDRDTARDLESERERLRRLFRERDERHANRYAPDRPAVRLEDRLLRETLVSWPLVSRSGAAVLEIGCGHGAWLERLHALPSLEHAALYGVDLVPERLAIARDRCSDATLTVACGSALPFPPARFDLVVLATVTSGLRTLPMRRALADEVRRVLRPEGRLLHYDLVRAGGRSRDWTPVTPIEAAVLFELPIIRSRRLGLLPPIARGLAPLWPGLAASLARRPFLPSHGLALLGLPDDEVSA